MDFAYVTKPDSTIDKNKPAKTKHDQKTESNSFDSLELSDSFGAFTFPDVEKCVKICGKRIDVNNINVKMKIVNVLKQNATFNEVIRKAYPSTIKPSTLAFNCIKQTAEALEEMDIDCNGYEDIAEIISQLMAKRLDGQNLTQHKYIIGSTEQFFSKDDFEAIRNDEMFKNIREEQKKGKQESNPDIDFETINMSQLRYNNFYSRSAMRDEVKRRQIENGMPKAKGIGRPKSKYKVSLPSNEISWAYREYTLNHVTPVSEITSGHSSSQINTDEIQNEAWESTNIVLGPDKNRRIYEPGNVKDIEADKICSFSETKVKILDTQTNEMVEIKAESPVTAMRTDYVQFFYNECLKISKKTSTF